MHDIEIYCIQAQNRIELENEKNNHILLNIH